MIKLKKLFQNLLKNYHHININKENLEPIINELIKKNDTNFKGVGQPIRIALTGSKFGPGLYDIVMAIGKRCLNRLVK